MTTKPRQPRTAAAKAAKRPISITAVVDCVGALAARDLHGSLYLYDTNKAGGSAGFGTDELRTRVRAGDQLLWTTLALECEAYVSIDAVVIDSDICEPERKVFPGTDVSYWIGTVKKNAAEPVPYRLSFLLGTRTEPITTTVPLILDSDSAGPASASGSASGSGSNTGAGTGTGTGTGSGSATGTA